MQQGDPLGPLHFCLVFKELLESLRSELVLGYLEDMATVVDLWGGSLPLTKHGGGNRQPAYGCARSLCDRLSHVVQSAFPC